MRTLPVFCKIISLQRITGPTTGPSHPAQQIKPKKNITVAELNKLLSSLKGPIELDLNGCRNVGCELILLPEGVQITKLNIAYSSATAEQVTGLLNH